MYLVECGVKDCLNKSPVRNIGEIPRDWSLLTMAADAPQLVEGCRVPGLLRRQMPTVRITGCP